MPHPRLLNIGCGAHFHPDWINLDVAPADAAVMRVDISHGLPFAAGFADVCYSSHVLEHLDRAGAQHLVRDCSRVLKPGGVIRVVLPDLEAMAREYLRVLDSVTSGNGARQSDYEWMMLELYDQTVRRTPGGEMARFLAGLDAGGRGFVRSRIGLEAEAFWSPRQPLPSGSSRAKRARNWRNLIQRSREKLAGCLVHLVAGRAALESFETGLFRSSGEVHQWMYDRHSLKRLLERAGFRDVRICAAGESRIPDFARYSLDVTNGVVRKPDSLYVEASKP